MIETKNEPYGSCSILPRARVAPHTVGWAFHINQSLVKKMSQKCVYRPKWQRCFLSWGSLFLVCVKLTKTSQYGPSLRSGKSISLMFLFALSKHRINPESTTTSRPSLQSVPNSLNKSWLPSASPPPPKLSPTCLPMEGFVAKLSRVFLVNSLPTVTEPCNLHCCPVSY